jgi:hypothetical protein
MFTWRGTIHRCDPRPPAGAPPPAALLRTKCRMRRRSIQNTAPRIRGRNGRSPSSLPLVLVAADPPAAALECAPRPRALPHRGRGGRRHGSNASSRLQFTGTTGSGQRGDQAHFSKVGFVRVPTWRGGARPSPKARGHVDYPTARRANPRTSPWAMSSQWRRWRLIVARFRVR